MNWKWVKVVGGGGGKSRTRNCPEISRPPEMAKTGPGPLSPLRVSWQICLFLILHVEPFEVSKELDKGL